MKEARAADERWPKKRTCLRHLLFRGSFAHKHGGKKLAAVTLKNNIFKELNVLTYLVGTVDAHDAVDTCATAKQNINLASLSRGRSPRSLTVKTAKC